MPGVCPGGGGVLRFRFDRCINAMNVICAFTVLFLFIGGLKFVNENCWKTKREGKEVLYYMSLIEEVGRS